MARHACAPFPYRRPAELDAGGRGHARAVIVGAGPVGLSAAIGLALHGIASVVVDDNDVVSLGSRAICWSQRTLDVMHRLGVGARMVEKGVTWKVGRLYRGEREIYAFDLQPGLGARNPAFINLQQYHVEQFLVGRCADFPGLIDLRWKHKVAGLAPRADGVTLDIETPDGAYKLEAGHVIACDGAKSTVRAALGLDFSGRVFEERFLIADIEMRPDGVHADFPSERRFWFEPAFHAGQSALLHKQPDDIYRIDLQLGRDADPDEERKPDRVIPRIKAMVGERPFEIDWVSVYTFQCRRLERFVHGRVIFAGDSAHVVSPFGARGGNGGMQDADNLCWKLAAVLKGDAPERLLLTYDEERVHAADEDILHSSRSTNFMTPKSEMEKLFRSAALDLAGDMDFARKLVNSGRLSTPAHLRGLSLQTPAADCAGMLAPGAACADAPVRDAQGKAGYLLDLLGGQFCLLAPGGEAPATPGLRQVRQGVDFDDCDGKVAALYGAGVAYLIRPDQHVAARFATPQASNIFAPKIFAAQVAAAHSRALGWAP